MDIWPKENINTHDFVKSLLPNSEIKIYEDKVSKSYIAGFFVYKQYQGCGIGRSLLNECKKIYPHLKLDVFAKNINAIEFYKKNGFYIANEKVNADTKEKEHSMVWIIIKQDMLALLLPNQLLE